MKVHEIEKGDTIKFNDFSSNAEYELEDVDLLKTDTKQFLAAPGKYVNIIRFTIGSTKFKIKSDTKIDLEDDESEQSTEGVN